MKKIWQRINDISLVVLLSIMTLPALADLPTPPEKDLANGTNDWVDVGGSLTYRVLSIVCIALGVLILVSVAAGVAKAYSTAHEKQDLGHFFKMLVVGLVCAAIGIGLVYGGYSILPTQS